MVAFYLVPEPSGRRWRVQAPTFWRSSAPGFWAAISRRPHTRAAERCRATGGRTGELHQDWQGAFVVTHIGRAGLIV